MEKKWGAWGGTFELGKTEKPRIMQSDLKRDDSFTLIQGV